MGWLFSLILFVYGCFTKDSTVFIGAGLFAVAGSIGFYSTLSRVDKKAEKKQES